MNGEELRQRRLALGLTQATLAARLDVTRQAIYAWERGINPIPGSIILALRWLEHEHGERLDVRSIMVKATDEES